MALLILACTALVWTGGTLATVRPASSLSGGSGTLSVALDRNADGSYPGPVFYATPDQAQYPPDYAGPLRPTGHWYPGMTATRRLFVRNVGTLPFRVTGLRALLTGVEEPAARTEYLERQEFTVTLPDDPDLPPLYTGPLDGLQPGADGDWVSVPAHLGTCVGAGAAVPLDFFGRLHPLAGDAVQGLDPVVSFQVRVTQTAGFDQTPTAGGALNLGFETGDFSQWHVGPVLVDANVSGPDGYTQPYRGCFMARLSNWLAPQAVGPNTIRQRFVVTEPELRFAYNLFTYDGEGIDRWIFRVLVVDSAGTHPAWRALGGWGEDGVLKSTGWQEVRYDISPWLGRQVQIWYTLQGIRHREHPTWVYVDSAEPLTGGG